MPSIQPSPSDDASAPVVGLPDRTATRLRSLERQERVLRIRRWVLFGGAAPVFVVSQILLWGRMFARMGFTPQLVVSALVLIAILVVLAGTAWHKLDSLQGELEVARQHLRGEVG